MDNRLLQKINRLRRYYEKTKFYLAINQRKELERFNRLRSRFYLDFWNASASAIGAQVEDLGYGFLRITKETHWTIVRLSSVMLDNHLILEFVGNKPIIHKLLREQGYPVPNYLEYRLDSIHSAYQFLQNLGKPTVVKPASGTGGGRGVTTRISNKEQLKKASLLASAFDNDLVIEEQVEGHSFRLLYLGGRFLDAVRREPPSVTGDGKSSLKQLIKKENEVRLGGDPITALSPITVDMECKQKLAEDNRDLGYVPRMGESVVVKAVVNQNSANENFSIRDEIHPSVVELGAKMVREFGIELAGVDIIAKDLRLPLAETGGVINEINTTPGLHHHFLIDDQDKRLPIGGEILDFLFSHPQIR
jgi:D-alanine-D-alanine ligase-like ATP-grasp enzyme